MTPYFSLNYWKFLLKSTNQHGVHSPFVYNLVTECFYNKKEHYNQTSTNGFPKLLRAKQISLLNYFIPYFQVKKPTIFAPKNHGIYRLPNLSKLSITQIQNKKETADFVYIASETSTSGLTEIISQKITNQSVIIFETPYQNEKLWIYLKKQNFARVIVDTYYFGFLFPREQQAKQEFFIRI